MDINKLLNNTNNNSDDELKTAAAPRAPLPTSSFSPQITTAQQSPHPLSRLQQQQENDHFLAASILSELRYDESPSSSHSYLQRAQQHSSPPRQRQAAKQGLYEQHTFFGSPASLSNSDLPRQLAPQNPRLEQLEYKLLQDPVSDRDATVSPAASETTRPRTTQTPSHHWRQRQQVERAHQENTISEGSPRISEPDEADVKAIAEALNEFGTRHARRSFSSIPTPKSSTPKASTPRTPNFKMASSPPATEMDVDGAPSTNPPEAAVATSTEPIKVETSKPASKATKKGIAKKPPALAKKRKLNDGSPVPASPAPSTGKKSGKKSAPSKASQSATPVPQVPESESEPESVEDENMVYCICRKPDNHTWMIGCDGGCEDWFHGKCVGVRQEDEELIDRYICPNCTEKGIGVTTWKPMCRRPGCNRPARLKKGGESKYCSDACGEDFWRDQLAVHAGVTTKKSGTKRKAQSDPNEDDVSQEPNPLGQAIVSRTLKSLAQTTGSAPGFRRMGSPDAMTPPDSRPGTSSGPKEADLKYTEHEHARFAEINARKAKLRDLRQNLKEREDFLRLTRERAARSKERNGGKNVCGYDTRLAWDDVHLHEWVNGPAGQDAMNRQTLSPPPDKKVDANVPPEAGAVKVCEKKSCKRHEKWAKFALQEVRFDEEQVSAEMKQLLIEEEEIKRAARVRKHGAGGERHGWVEMMEE